MRISRVFLWKRWGIALFVIRYDICDTVINTLFISSFADCDIEIYSLICKPENILKAAFFRTWTGYGPGTAAQVRFLLGFQRARWVAAFRRVGAAYPPRVVSSRKFQQPRKAPYYVSFGLYY